jgi:N-formylglutamate amidohydrolase
LTAIVDDPEVKLIVDCHSMAAVGPDAYDDPSALRPRVSASNLGDEQGEPRESWGLITAPPAMTRFFGKRMGELLADIPDLTASGAPYALNAPYLGGWAMRLYGGSYKPWLMVELSRSLYIGKQESDTSIVAPDSQLLKDIGERVWQAIEELLAS